MLDHPWPGNVRELENVIERAVVLSSGPEIGVDLLPDSLKQQGLKIAPEVSLLEGGFSFYETMEQFEREIIVEGLKRVNSVQRRAAELEKDQGWDARSGVLIDRVAGGSVTTPLTPVVSDP